MFKIDKISHLLNQPIANYYFVVLEVNDRTIILDNKIAKKIGISIEEYTKQLLQFNGYIFDGIYFRKKQDCVAACEHLNTVYGVMNKLSEE